MSVSAIGATRYAPCVIRRHQSYYGIAIPPAIGKACMLTYSLPALAMLRAIGSPQNNNDKVTLLFNSDTL